MEVLNKKFNAQVGQIAKSVSTYYKDLIKINEKIESLENKIKEIENLIVEMDYQNRTYGIPAYAIYALSALPSKIKEVKEGEEVERYQTLDEMVKEKVRQENEAGNLDVTEKSVYASIRESYDKFYLPKNN